MGQQYILEFPSRSRHAGPEAAVDLGDVEASMHALARYVGEPNLTYSWDADGVYYSGRDEYGDAVVWASPYLG